MNKVILILGLNFICFLAGPFSGRVVMAGGGDYAAQANYIANAILCARVVLARNLDIINTPGAKIGQPVPEGATRSTKGIYPALFGRLMADEFVIRTGISVKQTTLGKGRLGPRNFYNTPDAWEKAVLEKFNSRSYPKGVGFGEFTPLEGGQKLAYRYILPLYIEKACLQCHGDPANSPTRDGHDISGHQMEGYKEGEVRGGISVTIPVTELPAFLLNSKYLSEAGESH